MNVELTKLGETEERKRLCVLCVGACLCVRAFVCGRVKRQTHKNKDTVERQDG